MQDLKHFKNGFPNLEIVNPATIGNGIFQLNNTKKEKFSNIFENSNFKILKFVPASGAASRGRGQASAGRLRRPARRAWEGEKLQTTRCRLKELALMSGGKRHSAWILLERGHRDQAASISELGFKSFGWLRSFDKWEILFIGSLSVDLVMERGQTVSRNRGSTSYQVSLTMDSKPVQNTQQIFSLSTWASAVAFFK